MKFLSSILLTSLVYGCGSAAVNEGVSDLRGDGLTAQETTTGTQGEAGPKGEKGAPGDKGDKGEKGANGADGDDGADAPSVKVIDANGKIVGTVIDWIQSLVLFTDGSIGTMSMASGEIRDAPFYQDNTFSLTSGSCAFASVDCSGTCYFIQSDGFYSYTPIKSALHVRGTGLYAKYQGSAPQSVTIQSIYYTDSKSCLALGGSSYTMSHYPLANYTLPVGLAFPIATPITLEQR